MKNDVARTAKSAAPRFAWGAAAVLALVAGFVLVLFRASSQPARALKTPAAASVAVRAVRLAAGSRPLSVVVRTAGRPGIASTARDSQTVTSEAVGLVNRICDALAASDASWQTVVSSGLLPALVRADPKVAACMAENWEPGELREGLLREVGREWAAAHGSDALAWAENLPNLGERNDVLGDICIQISQTDPAQAIAVAERLGIGQGDGMIAAAAQLWAGQDYPAALQWALQQPAGEERDRLLTRVAFAESQFSPADAARVVEGSISSGPIKDEAVISVVHQWGLRDASAALAWVASLPPTSLRDRAINELAGLGYH